jgi:predicted DNA-binding transcriptional regulator AlpA
MTIQRQRPGVAARGVEGESVCLNPTAPGNADTGSIEADGPVPVHYKLRWTWADVEALTGMSKRWMQREISAGRMPAPDLRAGRRAGWRPSTILGWLDAMADRQGRRSGR